MKGQNEEAFDFAKSCSKLYALPRFLEVIIYSNWGMYSAY